MSTRTNVSLCSLTIQNGIVHQECHYHEDSEIRSSHNADDGNYKADKKHHACDNARWCVVNCSHDPTAEAAETCSIRTRDSHQEAQTCKSLESCSHTTYSTESSPGFNVYLFEPPFTKTRKIGNYCTNRYDIPNSPIKKPTQTAVSTNRIQRVNLSRTLRQSN